MPSRATWKAVPVAHGSAVKTLTSNFSISAVSGTVSALRGVAASASSLLDALSKQCPSASSSPST